MWIDYTTGAGAFALGAGEPIRPEEAFVFGSELLPRQPRDCDILESENGHECDDKPSTASSQTLNNTLAPNAFSVSKSSTAGKFHWQESEPQVPFWVTPYSNPQAGAEWTWPRSSNRGPCGSMLQNCPAETCHCPINPPHTQRLVAIMYSVIMEMKLYTYMRAVHLKGDHLIPGPSGYQRRWTRLSSLDRNHISTSQWSRYHIPLC